VLVEILGKAIQAPADSQVAEIASSSKASFQRRFSDNDRKSIESLWSADFDFSLPDTMRPKL
jgi:hypothetical protein